MRVSRTTTVAEIDSALRKLGAGNHEDNMQVLASFPHHFFLELSEKDFFELVFLQCREVAEICPSGADRTLHAVAYRAVHSPKRQLGPNWDLDQVNHRTEEVLCTSTSSVSPLFLRDARHSEKAFGCWYLQDGSHRALGYAMAILTDRTRYSPLNAFCATTDELARIDGGPNG